MKVFFSILSFILLVTEGVWIALGHCNPGLETYLYIGFTCLAAFLAAGAVYGFADDGEIFDAVLIFFLSPIVIPLILLVCFEVVGLAIKLIQTFTLKGVIGIGTIIGLIIAALSSCVFIFFF